MIAQAGDDDVAQGKRRGRGRDDVIEHATEHGVREVSVRPAQRAVEQLHAELLDQREDDGIEKIVGRKRDDGAAQEKVERDGVEARDRIDACLEEITRRGLRPRRGLGTPAAERRPLGGRLLVQELHERGRGQGGDLSDGASRARRLHHEAEALDVVVRVQTASVRGTHRRDDRVALLPDAKHVRADTGAAGDDLDRVQHGGMRRSLRHMRIVDSSRPLV